MSTKRPVRRVPRRPRTPRHVPSAAPDGPAGVGKLLRQYGVDRDSVGAPPIALKRNRVVVALPGPDAARFRINEIGCQTVRDAGPQSVGMTYWFDTPVSGAAHDLPLRFVGTRIAVRHDVEAAGAVEFTSTHTVHGLPAGLGRVAATVRVSGVAPGQWQVVATPETPDGGVLATGQSGFTPFIGEYAPGVRLGAWPAMVSLGALVGVTLLGVLAARAGLSPRTVVALAIVACLTGLVGARIYFLAQTTERVGLLSLAGMCIQGFVIAAVATLVLGAWLLRLPLTTVLDIAAPGLLFGMALGRLGCWWGGCCAGRLSTSRFALWSSNRYIGARRVPTQLIEGSAALLLGLVALAVDLWDRTPHYGTLLAMMLAAYIVVRQLLFGLRDLPRRTRGGRVIAAATAGLAALAAIPIIAAGHLA